MRYFIITIIVLTNFLIESTVLHHLSVFDVTLNTSLIIIVCLALLAGKKTGSVLGLVIGLLEDIVFYDVIGVHALIYFLIGYLVGLTDKKVFKENLFLPFVFTFVSTIAFHIVYYVFMYFLSINIDFINLIKNVVVIEAIFNSLLSIFFYKQFLKLYRQPYISFRK